MYPWYPLYVGRGTSHYPLNPGNVLRIRDFPDPILFWRWDFDHQYDFSGGVGGFLGIYCWACGSTLGTKWVKNPCNFLQCSGKPTLTFMESFPGFPVVFWQIPKNVFFLPGILKLTASSHLKMDGLGRLILGADLFSDCKIAVSSFVAGAMVYSR